MRVFACFLIMFGVLTGCTRKTPTEIAFDAVDASVASLEKALPAECKTDVMLAQITTVRSNIETARLVCDADIKAMKIKYDRAMLALIIVIAVFLATNLLKK